jgi:hypothetical protein
VLECAEELRLLIWLFHSEDLNCVMAVYYEDNYKPVERFKGGRSGVEETHS